MHVSNIAIESFYLIILRYYTCPTAQGQRTVYRLTLVKEWNTEELEAYASLVARGNPDFIEVKVRCPIEWYVASVKDYTAPT